MARLRIGLTGGIASGKSTAAEILADLGAVVIDADQLAREVVEPGTAGLAQIAERFGDQVISDGHLDRPALGRIIFSDESARRDLEAIVHPLVRARAAALEAAAGPYAVVVQMIPLLVETGQADRFDVVMVVDVPPELQQRRLQERNGFTPSEAAARIAAQADRPARLAVADVVLDNGGDRAGLRRQVEAAYRDLLSRAPSEPRHSRSGSAQ